MKRILPFLLAALLLVLGACQPAPDAPVQDVPESPAPTDTTPPSPSAPEATPLLPVSDDSCYIFAAGSFLGSWSNDRWHSAHETDFTLGELFSRDYYNRDGSPVKAVRLYVGDGPGQFDAPEQAAALLDPFGIIEGDSFIMELPVALSAEAASLTVPNYSFTVSFDGQSGAALSDASAAIASPVFSDAPLPDDAVAQALEPLGLTCDLSRMERLTVKYDLDSDGQLETLELIQPLKGDGNYPILKDGDTLFYALLSSDDNGLSVVTYETSPEYSEDNLVAYLSAHLNIVCDFNGDGSLEIVLRTSCWEWGHYTAFSWTADGWIEVLRSEYGT